MSKVSYNRTASIKRNNERLEFIMLAKKDNLMMLMLMANDQFKTFSINLNAQHVNGMTLFLFSRTYVRLLDTLE